MRGRPSFWVVGGSLVLVVVVALVAWLAVRPDTYTARPPHDRPARVDPTAAARALATFQAAVDDRDQDAAAAVAPPDDAAAGVLLGQLVANAAALHVADFTMRYVDESGGVDTTGSWRAAVDMTWRFDGFDTSPVHEEVQVGFRDVADPGGTVAITGFGGGDDRSPLWLTEPLQVRRTGTSLVLAGTAAEATLVGRRADAAVTVVRRMLPDWPGRLVVEVPDDEPGLDAVLAAKPESYTDIAAVSAPVDGTTTPQSPVHVFVNPTVYDDLDPEGGQVVLSHEATHVATDAPVLAGAPLWLLEGFADYVALRDVDLPVATTAGQILAEVKRSGPPDHLPDSTDFDEHATHLGATYEAAWLVCRVLADAGGEPALVSFYDRVSHGQPLGRELQRGFGLTEGELLHRWQQRLSQLAAAVEAPA